MAPKRVVVTGGAGYIGSVLTEVLLDRGYDVTVVDRFFFGDTLAHLADRRGLRQVKADVRSVDATVFDGAYGVFDLAALSNDPAGDLDPDKTMDINHRGRARVARLAKASGVPRYVLASSCSVYGFQTELLTEESQPSPLTTYAEANLAAEQSSLPLASEEFCVTALRQATVYGLSPRMRFDLAVNGMTLGIFQRDSLPVLRDGSQWRPMVHVKDTSRAFVAVLEAPSETVNGQIFNVGSDEQNYQILPLARSICEAVGKKFAMEWYGDPDGRSYRVSFGKLRNALDFRAQIDAAGGAREIFHALAAGEVSPGPKTRTVEWYKLLLEWHRLLADVTIAGSVL